MSNGILRGMTASAKRVAVTWWLGEAYQELMSAKYATLRKAAWTKTGCYTGLPGADPCVKGAPPLVLVPETTPFTDDAYFNEYFSGADGFLPSDHKKVIPPRLAPATMGRVSPPAKPQPSRLQWLII